MHQAGEYRVHETGERVLCAGRDVCQHQSHPCHRVCHFPFESDTTYSGVQDKQVKTKGDGGMAIRHKSFILVTVMLALSLVPLTAHATLFTWTGGANNTWAYDPGSSPFNWSGGAAGHEYPGEGTSYADQATLSTTTNWPATISTGITLGGATTALTTTGSGNTTVAVDIASGGLLGMKGNISNCGRPAKRPRYRPSIDLQNRPSCRPHPVGGLNPGQGSPPSGMDCDSCCLCRPPSSFSSR